MGRLLVDLKVIDQRTVDKYRREADKIGKSSFALAWVLDSTTEERDRGVTVDFAMRNFETPKTKYTILDAPGHQDFVPNMIAGAAQADFAVLVVDASPNSFESGFQGGGQTKEHALLIRSMGVSRVVVAVNKLDAVAWSQARYTEIEQQLAAFLTSAGFQKQNLTFVPCSGLGGQNVVAPPAKDLIPWYSSSGTLIGALDAIKPTARALQKPLRLVVNEVFRSGPQNLLSIGGRLEAGHVQVGERILAVPAAATCQVRGVEIAGESREWAVAGDNVVLQLSSDVEETALKAGDVICPPAHPVASVGEFLLKALAFECLTPMHVEVHRGRLHVGGRVAEMRAVVDKVTGKVLKLRPRVVQPGSLCRLRVVLDGVVPLEAGARVVLRAGGRTVAAGLLE